jgi:DNA-binding NtrC family response regulator
MCRVDRVERRGMDARGVVLIGGLPGDDPYSLGLAARLRRSGVLVRRATGRAEVLRAVEAREASTAVLWDTPEVDGLSLLRMIRTIDGGLPSVLVTAAPDRRWLERALALRAETVFSPPVDLERMGCVITRLLERRGRPCD